MMFDKLKNLKRQIEERIKERDEQNRRDADKLREIEAAESLIIEMIGNETEILETDQPAATGVAPLSNEPVKLCRKCGQTKPLSQFDRDKSKHDGRHTLCKKCKRKRDRRLTHKQKPLLPFPPVTAVHGKKRCPVCAKVKPSGSFAANDTARDKLQWACRDCYSLRRKLGGWMRKCRICGELRPLTEFALNRAGPTGRRYECKQCARENTARLAEKYKMGIRRHDS